jgi:hypothetical protein
MGDFPPSHQPATFDGCLPAAPPAAVIPVFSSSQLPAFIGWDLVTTTGSSATSHATAFLESRLERSRLGVKHYAKGGARLPRLRRVPGGRFHPASHIRSDRVSGFALFRRLTAPDMPSQVRFRYVPLTSYGFLQTLPLPTTPLPIGLSSPRSG